MPFVLGHSSFGETPRAELDVRRSVAFATASLTTSATLNASQYILLVDTSGGAITATLPAASACQGRIYSLKLVDATNALTITPAGSDTIDGAASLVVTGLYDAPMIQSDGTSNWNLI